MIPSNSTKKIIVGIILILVVNLVGCSGPDSITTKYYTQSDIADIISSNKMFSSPEISSYDFEQYPTESFLFDNHCFSFYRDMDYYLGSSARFDYLNTVISEYPPQIVRTIENNGQKSMYFVYETDDDTRIFVFFFETDNFQYTRGYPIIMKKSLTLTGFSDLQIGDTIDDVEKIDPIASFYRRGYDTLSDEQIQKIYVEGRETISTVHLLSDGIVKITYDRDSNGEYVINHIHKSNEFIIPVLGGQLCYLIYSGDYTF